MSRDELDELDKLHDNVTRLIERNGNMINWSKGVLLLVLPALLGYLVYDHQQQEAIGNDVVIIRGQLATINEHGTRYVIEHATRHHAESGCHFNALEGIKK